MLFLCPDIVLDSTARRRGAIEATKRGPLDNGQRLLLHVSTLDDVTGMIHIMAAFVRYKGPGGPQKEPTNIHDWITALCGT
jgi:hypothetical protein